jgi:hypothetical protein
LIVRGLCAAAAAALAVALVTAPAAAAPSPAALRAALADPLEASFVEAEIGTQGTLEGPFDLNAYADYYRLSGTSESDIQRGVAYLKRDGFVGGYGRQWYRPRSTDVMGELVLVFGSNAGAMSSEQASKQRYQQDAGFQQAIDSSELGKSSFASTLASGGYDWTVIMFVKGNGLFAIARASVTDYRTPDALAQAKRAYAVAPSTIQLPGQQGPVAGVPQYARLVGMLALMLLLVIATAVAVVVYAVRAPRRHPSAPASSEIKQ